MSWIEFEPTLVEDLAARMDLRAPNKAAIAATIEQIREGTGREVICDLATGVGKTYITAGLIDYLAGEGVRNILIVTPGRTIQEKTIANFTPGNKKFVPGAEHPVVLITAENFARGQVGDALHNPDVLKVFVFNVQQLIRPTVKTSRRVRETDEFIGGDLYGHLQSADDLVVIADEHHVYRSQAKAFSSAVRELEPRALVGLTATPDKADLDKVIYQYSLAEAIADQLVKIPVIVYREDGHTSVETQLKDACHLLRVKAAAMSAWATTYDEPQVNPVLFVVCQTIDEAKEAAELLARDDFIGDGTAVLEITSQSSDEALVALARVEEPDSPIRAVVSVDKLKEGWDVKNIGVIVALRKLASESLTEQILGRGLRLPYGRRVGVPMIDSVDLVAHDSYRKLLQQKDILRQKILAPPTPLPQAGGGVPARDSEPPQDTGSEVSEQGTLTLVTPARVVDGETVDGTAALIIQDFGQTIAEGEAEVSRVTKILEPVPGAPIIKFPRREQKVLPVRFSLSVVKNSEAKATGARYATEVDVQLFRRAVNVSRGVDGEVTVRQEAQEAQQATQEQIPVEQVRSDLEDRILDLGLVESSLSEYNGAKRVVREFLDGAGVSADNGGQDLDMAWGEARAQQAVDGLAQLIRTAYANRKLQPEYEFVVKNMPVVPRPMPQEVHGRFTDFVAKRWYDGWQRSILPVANFDAKTTEWKLASLLDDGLKIKWWLRIQTDDPAYIVLDNGSRYFPDFIAIDHQDIHWLIEGKSDRDAATDDVRAKKAAAEEWTRYVNDEGTFGTWRYLFATEKMISAAKGSWDSLVLQAQPE